MIEELGFNKYESAVYEALVKIGKATAFQLSRESKVPYGRVYDVIESLANKGLLRTVPGTPKMYAIDDPKIIEEMLKERKQKLDKLSEELKRLKRIYESGPEEAIIVERGKKAWYDTLRTLPRPEKTNYAIKYTAEFNPEWVRDAKHQVKHKIERRTLARYDDETKDAVNKWLNFDKNVKRYKNNGVAVWIVDDKFIVLGLIKSNATIVIKDKAFIELMKGLFQDAYKNAEAIK